jgi:hypothetical protein
MGEEDRGEVDVCKVTTGEVIGAVTGEAFDPLGPRREVVLWIVRVGMGMAAAHCDGSDQVTRTWSIPISVQTAMKRPSSPSSASSKKQKKSPRVSVSVSAVSDGDDTDAKWERVERRKSKKARKTDAKLDVCVPSIAPLGKVKLTSHRRILLGFCTLIPRSSSAEILLVSTSVFLTLSMSST